jgi:uncharacterized protein (TIGR02246 family)
MSRAEIETADEQFSKAVASHDLDAAAGFYADDARMLAPNLPILDGRPAIREFFDRMMSGGVRAIDLDTIDVLEGGDLAVEYGRYRIAVDVAGGEPIEDRGKYVTVHRRQADGEYKIVVDTFHSDTPS